MHDLSEVYDQIREDLAKKTDAFGSMTLDGVHITASNMLIAHYLEQIVTKGIPLTYKVSTDFGQREQED